MLNLVKPDAMIADKAPIRPHTPIDVYRRAEFQQRHQWNGFRRHFSRFVPSGSSAFHGAPGLRCQWERSISEGSPLATTVDNMR